MAFCAIVRRAIHRKYPNADVLQLPLADGGDGTIDVIKHYLDVKPVCVTVSNPFFKPVKARYLYTASHKIAYIEMAEASGVKLVATEALDCKNATSLGTGELIKHAINKGAKEIILGIGGSATNDCGIGMATALGYRFLDEKGIELQPIGANLYKIACINTSKVHPDLDNVKFSIACDVTNPLHGSNGAAQVFASQKGASLEDIITLDNGLKSFAKLLKLNYGIDAQQIKGAGAAGGMGIAARVFLNGELKSGVAIVKAIADFDKKIKDAQWVITGEGQLDDQTASGKTIQGVLASAKNNDAKVAAFCGNITLTPKALEDLGIVYADAIMHYTSSVTDAMVNAEAYLEKMTAVFLEKIDL